MARIKLDFSDKFLFSTIIPVRITDLNYGNHLANDKVLSIIHESRIQFFQHYGYSELNFGVIKNDNVFLNFFVQIRFFRIQSKINLKTKHHTFLFSRIY